MATVSKAAVSFDNLAELWERLGEIPMERILMKPPPGTATEQDVVAAEAEPRKRLCELVDGVLVEKAMGARESLLAGVVIQLLGNYAADEDLGVVLGADGMLRLFPGQVRIPDVSFISWGRIPGGAFPEEPIPDLVPDLAVEVLSPSNTTKEMQRKVRDYFKGGVQLVWLIHPKSQTAEVYSSSSKIRRVGKTGALDGEAVLPGFRLPLKDLFKRTTRRKGA